MADLERVAVSSATFIDLSQPVSYGTNIIKELLKGGLYAPEIPEAIKTAEEFGIGLEIVYRVGLERVQAQILESGLLIHQIHGPAVWSLKEAVSEASGANKNDSVGAKIKNTVQAIGVAVLANGTLKRDWDKTKDIAAKLGAKNIVLHPNGAEILYKNREVIFTSDEKLVVGIEPDFRRLTEKPGVIWNPDEVIRIAEMTNQGIVLDTSHTVITHNSLDEMFRLYERYKREVEKGVVAIHFSVAIPGKDREEFFTQGTVARPLYTDTPDWVKGAYVEFYQHVMKDPGFKPLVLEMWSFPQGNSFDERKRACGETLNALEGSKMPRRTYSTP